jgi:hypothetical protein
LAQFFLQPASGVGDELMGGLIEQQHRHRVDPHQFLDANEQFVEQAGCVEGGELLVEDRVDAFQLVDRRRWPSVRLQFFGGHWGN